MELKRHIYKETNKCRNVISKSSFNGILNNSRTIMVSLKAAQNWKRNWSWLLSPVVGVKILAPLPLVICSQATLGSNPEPLYTQRLAMDKKKGQKHDSLKKIHQKMTRTSTENIEECTACIKHMQIYQYTWGLIIGREWGILHNPNLCFWWIIMEKGAACHSGSPGSILAASKWYFWKLLGIGW